MLDLGYPSLSPRTFLARRPVGLIHLLRLTAPWFALVTYFFRLMGSLHCG